jgi:hydroxymethylglutaryl-CoA lyase
MTERAEVFEVGPRDGLQNEKAMIATKDKVELVNRLSACGFRRIEVASFVSPKWVPQMADSAEVLSQITRSPSCNYAALTPNMRGFEGAVAAKADEIAIFASASEGFSQANINCTVAESVLRFADVIAAAKDVNLPVRGYISCVTDCPFDGPTPAASVASLAAQLHDLGCYEISLGDTIGHGTPKSISNMLKAVLSEVGANHLAGHYHDTAGRALDNIRASLECGVRVFDASVGGLGGCPYAPGASGNVASEAVVEVLHIAGFETGVDLAVLKDVTGFAKSLRGSDV